MLRIILKIISVPVLIVMTLIEWCGIFLVGTAQAVVNFIAGLLFIVIVLSYLIGLFSGMECLRDIGIVLIFVIACNLLVWMLSVLHTAKECIKDFVWN